MQKNWDVIIAGGGAAGLSAALMLGRARRRVLVIDDGLPRNRFADHMHGVLGHEGLPPRDLLVRGRAEAAAYGVEFLDASIDTVTDSDLLTVGTAQGAESTRTLIVATGVTDSLPAIPGLQERWGKTVLHCPYCHGWEVRGERIGILVTSPLGMHQAELLRQWSDRVTVFPGGHLAPEALARLRTRGTAIVEGTVDAVLGAAPEITAVRMHDGQEIPVDAIFATGTPRPRDEFLAPLDLARTEGPFGSALAVDAAGQTSHPRIWAVGNVTNLGANVPIAMGAGAMTGAVVNAALVGWEYDAASADPSAYWEEHYSSVTRKWSGNVNRVLADVASSLPPGTSLDLGSGEGADVVWLARQGWAATGVEISPTAVRRARAAAEDTTAQFLLGTLDELPDGEFDLITASFLHSPVALNRADILRNAASRVASGGHLLVTSHAAPPPWSKTHWAHRADRFLSPEEEVAQLQLDAEQWDALIAETRERKGKGPEGQETTLDDVVVLLRRR